MVFLTADEFATLELMAPPQWRDLIHFLAISGCRWGEATALTFADLNRDATPPTIRIDKAWKHADHGVTLGPPKTVRGNRTIGLPVEAVNRLGRGKPGDLIFRAPKGVARVDYSHFWTRVWTPTVRRANDLAECAKHGVKPIGKRPRIHDLRHSHASWLIAAGVPLTVIQRRLGHESIKTTSDLYGHLMPDVQQVAVAAVESVLAIE